MYQLSISIRHAVCIISVYADNVTKPLKCVKLFSYPMFPDIRQSTKLKVPKPCPSDTIR